jgi:trimethylamine--corrinoid protein Co-methyltransferase
MQSSRKRSRGRSRRQASAVTRGAPRGLAGGRFRPLTDEGLSSIDSAARSILIDIGFGDAPPAVVERVVDAGGSVDADGRLRFSAALIDQAIDGFARDFALCAQDPAHDLHPGGARVYLGSGGAAPLILDLDSGCYRDSTLRDLYDAARLVDSLDNIHFFSRSLVARDMPDLDSLDLNTAYACLAGTRKHVFSAASSAASVARIAELCHVIAGSRDAFGERPLLSLNCNLAVPPLRFDAESCAVAAEAVRHGIPLHVNTFGQMGASSPVTTAGTLAQTVAETLGGMIFAWLLDPAAKLIFGTRTMLTDLRSGAMSGGSGEGAMAMAACAQLANYYRLPGSTIAGATDSKLADAQSGYEKGLAITLAAQAGSNLITQACGMQASLMGCALESYVIDNDLLGAVMQSLQPIAVSDETLALDAIDQVVRGEGHFLGRPETLARMQSDFVYPETGDRRAIDEWQAGGGRDIREVAIERTRQILASHYPRHLADNVDSELRARFDIRLPPSAMEPA